ncbi:hypothetical protein ACOSQ3_013301 [Xanthoceras sorbifolium]
MYSWNEAPELTEKVATSGYEAPPGYFLCGVPHESTDYQVGNPFAGSRSEEQQYENYLYFQQNNPYPTIDCGAPLRCFLCERLHVSTDCQTQANAQSLAIQSNQLATDIQWQEHEPYPMVQCNEMAVEIEEQVE